MPDHSRHLIGMLLGAEEDWPQAFEAILRRVGPVTDASGIVHDVESERLTIEPFELTDPANTALTKLHARVQATDARVNAVWGGGE